MQRLVAELSQQTKYICITFIQRRPNIFDVGPALYKCYTFFCAHWDVHQTTPHSVRVVMGMLGFCFC